MQYLNTKVMQQCNNATMQLHKDNVHIEYFYKKVQKDRGL